MMQSTIFISFILYTLMLFLIMWLTSRKADNETYFRGNRRSPWFVVAYGMIGASLSGVTLLSVSGDVYNTQFTYFGIVIGYVIGYAVIALILLPLYYRLNLTSIYSYLEQRFGVASYKTGAFFFVLSRLLGSAIRLYLMIYVLQEFVFKHWGIPVWLTACIFVIIILLYTFKGGIRTVVWTDLLQTTLLLAALLFTVLFIPKEMNFSFTHILHEMHADRLTTVFETNWHNHNFFIKQILSGAFITITMTGLDQDMMQKNLSCKNLKDAQKNMFTFSGILVFANALFLLLGGMLIVFANHHGIDVDAAKTDRLFPTIAFEYMPPVAGIVFVLGLIAAGYSSADGTLTSLTTVVCVDFLGLKKSGKSEKEQIGMRRKVHVLMGLLFLAVILIFAQYHNDALIRIIFRIASYTYGPLLGLYTFGLYTKRKIPLKKERLVPLFACLSPLICLILNRYSKRLFWGYEFGFELLLLNGLIMMFFLWTISERKESDSQNIFFEINKDADNR
ncbi:MAG: sodium:solute symporter [Bacteroidales bacterium]|jgi:SSS family transporter|nr:sodium:solute symporter [Bacteroidales bacterium]